MGACASFPKGMKGEAAAAPAPVPEPAKEEPVKAVESTEEVNVEQEKTMDDEAKHQSPVSLPDEVDAEKKEKSEEKMTSEEVPVTPKDEEQKKPNEGEQKKPKEEEQKEMVAPATAAPENTQENNKN